MISLVHELKSSSKTPEEAKRSQRSKREINITPQLKKIIVDILG